MALTRDGWLCLTAIAGGLGVVSAFIGRDWINEGKKVSLAQVMVILGCLATFPALMAIAIYGCLWLMPLFKTMGSIFAVALALYLSHWIIGSLIVGGVLWLGSIIIVESANARSRVFFLYQIFGVSFSFLGIGLVAFGCLAGVIGVVKFLWYAV